MNALSRQARRIGAMASASGLTPDAIRYYERLGLVPNPPRTDGGFRVYPPDTVARLRFIKQAQKLGLDLREIRELLAPAAGATNAAACAPCSPGTWRTSMHGCVS